MKHRMILGKKRALERQALRGTCQPPMGRSRRTGILILVVAAGLLFPLLLGPESSSANQAASAGIGGASKGAAEKAAVEVKITLKGCGSVGGHSSAYQETVAAGSDLTLRMQADDGYVIGGVRINDVALDETDLEGLLGKKAGEITLEKLEEGVDVEIEFTEARAAGPGDAAEDAGEEDTAEDEDEPEDDEDDEYAEDDEDEDMEDEEDEDEWEDDEDDEYTEDDEDEDMEDEEDEDAAGNGGDEDTAGDDETGGDEDAEAGDDSDEDAGNDGGENGSLKPRPAEDENSSGTEEDGQEAGSSAGNDGAGENGTDSGDGNVSRSEADRKEESRHDNENVKTDADESGSRTVEKAGVKIRVKTDSADDGSREENQTEGGRTEGKQGTSVLDTGDAPGTGDAFPFWAGLLPAAALIPVGGMLLRRQREENHRKGIRR